VTKIHIHQLRSLEEGWGRDRPAYAFIRGFVSCYAKYLGLDENMVLTRFAQHAGEFKDKASVPTVKAPEPAATYTTNSGKPMRFGSYGERKDQMQIAHLLSTKRALYTLLVILGFVLLVFLMKLGKKATEEGSLGVNVDASVVSPQPATRAVDKEAGGNSAAALFAGSPPYDVTLVASGDCWLNMQVDNEALVSFKLSQGQSRKVVFNKQARITFSNANILRFVIAGLTYKSTLPVGKDETIVFPEETTTLVPE
jgi:cytoskeletal protein RodZ